MNADSTAVEPTRQRYVGVLPDRGCDQQRLQCDDDRKRRPDDQDRDRRNGSGDQQLERMVAKARRNIDRGIGMVESLMNPPQRRRHVHQAMRPIGCQGHRQQRKDETRHPWQANPVRNSEMEPLTRGGRACDRQRQNCARQEDDRHEPEVGDKSCIAAPLGQRPGGPRHGFGDRQRNKPGEKTHADKVISIQDTPRRRAALPCPCAYYISG